METVVRETRSASIHPDIRGEQAPPLIEASPGKFAIWLFIVSDALTFTALLFGYGFMRLIHSDWPVQTQVFDMRLITFMTFILISSSALMAMGVAASRNGDRKHVIAFLGATIAGGIIFLVCQAYEWTHFIREGARLTGNPWGIPQFSASFFVITGFHGLHVLSGVVALAVMAARAVRLKCSAEGIEIAGLYWHFVDVVWVFIFAFFYLF